MAAVPGSFIMDAELTVDEASGRSSFELLRNRASTKRPMNVRAAVLAYPARLYAFDLMALCSKDLRRLPLAERQCRLREVFAATRTLLHVSGVEGVGEWAFEQARQLDLEGMVAKRLESPYARGRSRDWLKIKP